MQYLNHRSYSVQTSNPDPWRRLAAKIIERAVLDVLQGSINHKISGAYYLTSPDARRWADEWELQLPWDKIQTTARRAVSGLAGGKN